MTRQASMQACKHPRPAHLTGTQKAALVSQGAAPCRPKEACCSHTRRCGSTVAVSRG